MIEEFELYPDFQVRVIRVLSNMKEYFNTEMRLTEGLRSHERQLKVWSQGREIINGAWVVTNPKLVVTHAMPGTSFHEYGIAADFCFKGPDPYPNPEDLDPFRAKHAALLWDQFATTAKGFGLEWGGNWSSKSIDRPHLQLTYGLTLKDLKPLLETHGLKTVWARLDQVRGVKPGATIA